MLRRAQPESAAVAFARYQESLASRLRYALAELNLRACHDLTRPLRVLDAAGGGGIVAEWLLAQEHQVTIYDIDPQMLEMARTRVGSLRLASARFVQGEIECIGKVLSKDDRYDLILCHHALEYLDNGLDVLHDLNRLATSTGELSLITLNPVSEVIRSIVFKRDPVEAASKLADLRYDAKWFGQARLYPLEEILAKAEEAGWRRKGMRGIRVLADYLPEQDTAVHEEALIHLEAELGSREPFLRMGRYIQLSFSNARQS